MTDEQLAAIEAEVVERVAKWLENGACDACRCGCNAHSVLAAASSNLRSGEWGKKETK